MKKRRTFTSEFKAKTALGILENKETVIEAAQRIECHPNLIYTWVDMVRSNLGQVFEGGSKEQKAQQKKMEKYEKVITKITTQNDFLERVLTSLE